MFNATFFLNVKTVNKNFLNVKTVNNTHIKMTNKHINSTIINKFLKNDLRQTPCSLLSILKQRWEKIFKDSVVKHSHKKRTSDEVRV